MNKSPRWWPCFGVNFQIKCVISISNSRSLSLQLNSKLLIIFLQFFFCCWNHTFDVRAVKSRIFIIIKKMRWFRGQIVRSKKISTILIWTITNHLKWAEKKRWFNENVIFRNLSIIDFQSVSVKCDANERGKIEHFV